jgi:hypothetical protein
MRKDSATARHIHSLVHEMMLAVEVNDMRRFVALQRRAVALDEEYLSSASRRHVRRGYDMLWFCEIAEQYPAALARRPDLAAFVDECRILRRAFNRGRRDAALYARYDAPFCGYTQSAQYEAWQAGWDAASTL